MKNEIIFGVVRSVLMLASGSLIAKGYTDQATVESVAGAVVAIILAVISARAKVKLAKKVEANTAAGNPSVVPPSSTGAIVSLFAAGLLAVSFFTGCNGTLEPGGAYAPAGQKADQPFLTVDAGFKVAYASADAVFKWERDNEAGLWKLNHAIKHTVDKLRVESKDIAVRYARARAAYRANPTPAGLSDLELILQTIQKLSITAQAVIPKGN